MNSLPECIESLVGKEITLVFTSGDNIVGCLDRILPEDALVLRANGGAMAICSTANLNMICEGKFGVAEEDEPMGLFPREQDSGQPDTAE